MLLRALGRVVARVTRERARRLEEGLRAPTQAERELVEHRVDDWKEDVFVAGGDGAVTPVLPIGTPEDLYEEFERDATQPRDRAR
jgi:hypothetical protein